MKIMAIDYGDAHTGIAISDATGTLAGFSTVINSRRAETVAQEICALIPQHGVTELVLGYPKNMDGTVGPRAEKAAAFGQTLKELTGLPVTLWDERRTTIDAHNILFSNGQNAKKRKKTVDAVAAALMLEARSINAALSGRGGGASGMAAALTAARAGHQVVLAERQARVGRKLLATGNGRCNLTNENARPDRYHGEDPDFCRFALEDPELSAAGTLDFFRQLGLVTVTEPGGRVYPLSNAAASVLDVLRFALEQQENIRVRTGCVIRQLKRREGQFLARTEEGDTITAQRCILAAGGAAGGKLGGGMDGYQLARQLGHHRTALYPSLVQVCTDPTYPRGLKGVKAQAALTLTREGETLTAGQGEVLFTEYGVSGPAVFDLSRQISTGGDGIALHLDFLPGWSREDTLAWLHSRRTALSRQEAGALLTGSVHPRLGRMLCKAAGINGGAAISEVTDRQLEALCRRVRDLALPVTGTCGFDQAQVTAGGLRTGEFDPRTMESRLTPGFYACGEVLDVDGDCGGFNLQWAWASGRLAGRLLSNTSL